MYIYGILPYVVEYVTYCTKDGNLEYKIFVAEIVKTIKKIELFAEGT